jgi:hypothetical protein
MNLPKLDFIAHGMSKISPFLAKAFSDGGSPSSSRILTLLHSLVACGVLIYAVVRTPNHPLPDGMTLTGLGAFSTAHYAVNRATNAWGKSNAPKPDDSQQQPGAGAPSS